MDISEASLSLGTAADGDCDPLLVCILLYLPLLQNRPAREDPGKTFRSRRRAIENRTLTISDLTVFFNTPKYWKNLL